MRRHNDQQSASGISSVGSPESPSLLSAKNRTNLLLVSRRLFPLETKQYVLEGGSFRGRAVSRQIAYLEPTKAT